MPYHQHTPPPRRGWRARAKVAIAGTLNDRFCSSLIILLALRPQVPNPTVSWIDILNAKRESTLHGTETTPMVSVFGLYSVRLIYESRQAGGARKRLCSKRYTREKKANGVYHRTCTVVIYPVRIGSKIIGPIIAIIALFSPFIAPFFTSPNLLPIHTFQ
ncbi:hypothetical protein BJ322DRAFT_542564 [Thelephora terrestris]|uniref:Uncharacterized protein n=1 Tax=Thelephora terrestris TaxID=56493 RepID=A0A9P6HMJ7_9AGAM|nr:hypothetical protein BJ322DRAFT_542564 [Thelephora terrestris]